MASIRPTIDHTLAVWIVSYLRANPPESVSDQIIASQVSELYINALSKAGLLSLLSPAVSSPAQAQASNPNPIRSYPFEQISTLPLSEQAKNKAMDYLFSNYQVTDANNSPETNLLAAHIYRIQALSWEATGEYSNARIDLNEPLELINKSIKLPAAPVKPISGDDL